MEATETAGRWWCCTGTTPAPRDVDHLIALDARGGRGDQGREPGSRLRPTLPHNRADDAGPGDAVAAELPAIFRGAIVVIMVVEEKLIPAQSCWPLPGLWSDYPETLSVILRSIAEFAEVDRAGQALSDVGLVPRPSSAVRQFQYLARLGVCERLPGGLIRLTKEGDSYLNTHNPAVIRRLLRSHISWVAEIEDVLAEGPATIGEIHRRLVDEFNAPWGTDWQVRFRLNWMRAYSMVTRLNEKQSSGRYPEWRLIRRR
jgi:hypothetical protein